ncbi:MAG: hypothetical protein U0V48_00110 [Anaerolineales bacterium]
MKRRLACLSPSSLRFGRCDMVPPLLSDLLPFSPWRAEFACGTKNIQDRNRRIERLVRERTNALEIRNQEIQAPSIKRTNASSAT